MRSRFIVEIKIAVLENFIANERGKGLVCCPTNNWTISIERKAA